MSWEDEKFVKPFGSDLKSFNLTHMDVSVQVARSTVNGQDIPLQAYACPNMDRGKPSSRNKCHRSGDKDSGGERDKLLQDTHLLFLLLLEGAATAIPSLVSHRCALN